MTRARDDVWLERFVENRLIALEDIGLQLLIVR
jgi:hypothetical protein